MSKKLLVHEGRIYNECEFEEPENKQAMRWGVLLKFFDTANPTYFEIWHDHDVVMVESKSLQAFKEAINTIIP